MVDIDRRTLLGAAGVAGVAGVAGAGLALASCDKKKLKPVDPVGYCDEAGQSVLHLAPEVSGGVAKCVPKYICVVYIKFDSDLKLKVRRAYVGPLSSTNPSPNPTAVENIASDVLKLLAETGTYSGKYWSDLDPIHLGNQAILVMYIDNRPDRIKFVYNENDTNTANQNTSFGNTIRFVKYRSKGMNSPARDNHAFFNIMKMQIETTGTLLESKVAFRLDYWNTNEMGRPIKADQGKPETHYIYSMNIHLEMLAPMADDTQKWIPIILDPDTGNMGGDP